MLSSQVAGNRFTVKTGAIIVKFADDVYGTEVGIEEFDNLYAFCKQHLNNFEHRLIEEHTTMHGAIQLMSKLILEELGLYVAIMPGEVRVGKSIEKDRYDFYGFPMKRIERAEQVDLQRVLSICMNKLDLFDPDSNEYWDYGVDIMYNHHMDYSDETDEQGYLDSCEEIRYFEEVMLPLIDTIYSHGDKIGNAEINRVCKDYPKYASFIQAVMKFDRCRSDLRIHDFEVDNSEDNLEPHRRFILHWESLNSGHHLDHIINDFAQGYYENNSAGPIGTYIVAGEEDLSLLKGRLKKLQLLIDLLSREYECDD